MPLLSNFPQGEALPELTNPGISTDLLSGKQLIDGNGKVVDGELVVNTVYVGTSEPASNLGVDGDIYIVRSGG